jgi:hypothetical protein
MAGTSATNRSAAGASREVEPMAGGGAGGGAGEGHGSRALDEDAISPTPRRWSRDARPQAKGR